MLYCILHSGSPECGQILKNSSLMQQFQEILHRQNINAAKIICPFTPVNTKHPIHPNTIRIAQRTHGSFPSSVPFLRHFHFQTDDVCVWWLLLFPGFNNKIDFKTASCAVKEYLPVFILSVIVDHKFVVNHVFKCRPLPEPVNRIKEESWGCSCNARVKPVELWTCLFPDFHVWPICRKKVSEESIL